MDPTKTIWTRPKQFVPVQNNLDGPKSYWTYRRTRHWYLIVWGWSYKKSFEMSKKELFTSLCFEKYEIWMVESARIIGFQLFCRFLKSTTTKLNTICFWQRKAKAPSGEFHFASYFSFRPFIYTQHYSHIHMWALKSLTSEATTLANQFFKRSHDENFYLVKIHLILFEIPNEVLNFEY